MRTRCSSAFDLKPPFGRARLDAQSWSCSVLNVITAQAQLLQSENDLADSDTQIATYLVNLYRALGERMVADVAFGAAATPRQKIEARWSAAREPLVSAPLLPNDMAK